MIAAAIGGGGEGAQGLMKFAQRRDYYAGALMMVLGAGAALQGSRYPLGSLTQMGPGFFPTVLGVLLAFIGALIAGTASVVSPAVVADAAPVRPDWRGWLCIICGAGSFIVLATYAGLAPATFACVFVAALGDRGNSWKEALLLAAGVTIFGTVLFSLLLHIQIPVFGSR
jgi:hypothetical protein